MKVAMMVRSFLQTPVPNELTYSPAGVAHAIAEGLAKRGHNITFFGPTGTHIDGATVENYSMRPFATSDTELEDLVSSTDLFTDYTFSLYDARMARHILQRAQKGEFDCVVFHHFESVLPLAPLFPDVQIVYVLHDYLDEPRRQVIEMNLSPNQHFISISDNQRQSAPDLPYCNTVYNGIDIGHFNFENDPEEYLFCAARIAPDKGIKEAIQVAIAANRRLLIAGNLLKANAWYFDTHIKPYLNDKILYLGKLDKEQLVKYYQKAYAFLNPIQWQEPFGLTMAEAGACGTPVITFRKGAAPEIIKDGKTGFVVDNSAEMIMAIEKIPSIKRQDCRAHIEKNFTVDIMVDHYEKALLDIIGKGSKTPPARTQLYKKVTTEIDRISRLLSGN